MGFRKAEFGFEDSTKHHTALMEHWTKLIHETVHLMLINKRLTTKLLKGNFNVKIEVK